MVNTIKGRRWNDLSFSVLRYLMPPPTLTKWWAGIVNEDAKRRKERGETCSRLLSGLPATWAANSFKTFWLQSFSMIHVRTPANSIDVRVRKSAPLAGYVHEG